MAAYVIVDLHIRDTARFGGVSRAKGAADRDDRLERAPGGGCRGLTRLTSRVGAFSRRRRLSPGEGAALAGEQRPAPMFDCPAGARMPAPRACPLSPRCDLAP